MSSPSPHEGAAAGPAGERPGGPPSRAAGVELLGPLAGSGYRDPTFLVRRPDGQTLQLTPLLYEVLKAADGRRTHLEMAWAVATETGNLLTAAEVAWLCDTKLVPLGLLHAGDLSPAPAPARAQPLLGLRLRTVVSSPRLTHMLTAPVTWLFHPPVVAAATAAFVGVSGWVLAVHGVGAALHDAFADPRLVLLVVALTVASAAFHELGHAAACRYGGARPGAMGAALYLLWPVFYTDVTDSYRLGRGGRLRVDLGGLYFNALFALATFAAWAATGMEALLVMVPIQLFQMTRQLVPLIRFDGYHILADLTGVPDLFSRIRPALFGWWRARQAKGAGGAAADGALKPWVRLVVGAWVAVVVPALAVFFVAIGLQLPAVADAAWEGAGEQWAGLREAAADGALAATAVRVLGIVLLAVPPLSMAYVLAMLARRSLVKAWRAAGGSLPRRGLVIAATASVVVATGLAWWPDGGPPLSPPPAVAETAQPAPGPAVVPVVPAAVVAEPVAERAPAPVRRVAVARSSSPPAATPAAVQPAARVRPPWPFPFDRPPAPGPQDNFAVAVNADDGKRVVDVAMALEWVEGEPVRHRNRAYALAACVDCTTVAAAFQVVIVSGDAPTVVPENIGVAVNYECDTCVTDAISRQLVMTVVQPVPPEVVAAVEAEWAQAQGLRSLARQLSPAELDARLARQENQIAALLRPYTRPPATVADAEPLPEAEPAGAATEGADPTPAAGEGSGDGAADSTASASEPMTGDGTTDGATSTTGGTADGTTDGATSTTGGTVDGTTDGATSTTGGTVDGTTDGATSTTGGTVDGTADGTPEESAPVTA